MAAWRGRIQWLRRFCVAPWWQTGREYALSLLAVLSHVTEPRVVKYALTLVEDVLDCTCGWRGAAWRDCLAS